MEKVTTLIQKAKMNDNNSCTVLALKSVSGWTEEQCYQTLKALGRKDNKGFDICETIGLYNELTHNGKTLKWTCINPETMKPKEEEISYYDSYRTEDWKPMTLKRFALANPKGVFYVVVRGHALAIVNGVIVDNVDSSGDRRPIQCVWKIKGGSPKIKSLKVNPTSSTRLKKFQVGDKIKYIGTETIKTSKGQILISKNKTFKITDVWCSPYGEVKKLKVAQEGKNIKFYMRGKDDNYYFNVPRAKFDFV